MTVETKQNSADGIVNASVISSTMKHVLGTEGPPSHVSVEDEKAGVSVTSSEGCTRNVAECGVRSNVITSVTTLSSNLTLRLPSAVTESREQEAARSLLDLATQSHLQTPSSLKELNNQKLENNRKPSDKSEYSEKGDSIPQKRNSQIENRAFVLNRQTDDILETKCVDLLEKESQMIEGKTPVSCITDSEEASRILVRTDALKDNCVSSISRNIVTSLAMDLKKDGADGVRERREHLPARKRTVSSLDKDLTGEWLGVSLKDESVCYANYKQIRGIYCSLRYIILE